jgi:hypothetical protein
VFEDTADDGRILETFLVESWMEHLRQHERVTDADRLVEQAAQRFNFAGPPKVTHFIAPNRSGCISIFSDRVSLP